MAVNFLKTGSASAQLAQKAAAEQQAMRDSQGKLWRFWLKEKEEARITFVDGELTAEGFLCPPRYYEHNLCLNGSWNNFFVCPEKTNPDQHDKCPICESGDRPSLVALFTIIDHREFTSKQNKTYKDRKKLLVAKSQTFEMLNKLATKLGGLMGQTFEVSRVGDKTASVGSMFIPVEKHTVQELQAVYQEEVVDSKTNKKSKVTYFTPADYEKEIIYRSGAELAKLLGSGQSQSVSGFQNQQSTNQQPVDYSTEL